jgi:transketolase
MVRSSLEAARHWPESAVWSAPSLKPLHMDVVAEICRQHQAIIVLEEHSIHGGLGSAIAEIAAECAPAWICRIGVADRFSRYCGSYQYLLTEHGLTTEAIIHRVTAFLARTSPATLAAA